jgi:Tetratricopeptide repeat
MNVFRRFSRRADPTRRSAPLNTPNSETPVVTHPIQSPAATVVIHTSPADQHIAPVPPTTSTTLVPLPTSTTENVRSIETNTLGPNQPVHSQPRANPNSSSHVHGSSSSSPPNAPVASPTWPPEPRPSPETSRRHSNIQTPRTTSDNSTTNSPNPHEINEIATFLKEQGNRLLRAGDIQSAIDNYTMALNQAPGNPTLLSNRAGAYSQLNPPDWSKSYEDALEATRRDPKFWKAWSRRGLANLKLNRPEEALAEFRRAEEEFRASEGPDAVLGPALREGLEEAIRLAPPPPVYTPNPPYPNTTIPPLSQEELRTQLDQLKTNLALRNKGCYRVEVRPNDDGRKNVSLIYTGMTQAELSTLESRGRTLEHISFRTFLRNNRLSF